MLTIFFRNTISCNEATLLPGDNFYIVVTVIDNDFLVKANVIVSNQLFLCLLNRFLNILLQCFCHYIN